MDSLLYHREIYMPPRVLAAFKAGVRLGFGISAHALKAAKEDRYGEIEIPPAINVFSKDIIEVEMLGGKLVKVVARKEYDATRDAIYAIAVSPAGHMLKTVWANLKTDDHKTLRRHLYQTK